VEQLLIRYGLFAVFGAAMVEADVVPVLAGVAAHRGFFNPVFAVIATSTGALTGDCIWFYLGRFKLLQQSKLFRRIRPKAEALFRRVGSWQIPASHVIYGTRVATMIFLGGRGSSFAKFALVDGLSCVALTTVLFSLGYGLSASASAILVNVRRVEIVLLGTVIFCGLISLLLQKLGRRFLQGTATGGGNS
jgi:membrane protein DedA with SNARE-associated domain